MSPYIESAMAHCTHGYCRHDGQSIIKQAVHIRYVGVVLSSLQLHKLLMDLLSPVNAVW